MENIVWNGLFLKGWVNLFLIKVDLGLLGWKLLQSYYVQMSSLGTLWCQIFVLWVASYPFFIPLSRWSAVSRGNREKRCFALSRAGCRFLDSGALMMEARIYHSLLALFFGLVSAMSSLKVLVWWLHGGIHSMIFLSSDFRLQNLFLALNSSLASPLWVMTSAPGGPDGNFKSSLMVT